MAGNDIFEEMLPAPLGNHQHRQIH